MEAKIAIVRKDHRFVPGRGRGGRSVSPLVAATRFHGGFEVRIYWPDALAVLMLRCGLSKTVAVGRGGTMRWEFSRFHLQRHLQS